MVGLTCRNSSELKLRRSLREAFTLGTRSDKAGEFRSLIETSTWSLFPADEPTAPFTWRALTVESKERVWLPSSKTSTEEKSCSEVVESEQTPLESVLLEDSSNRLTRLLQAFWRSLDFSSAVPLTLLAISLGLLDRGGVDNTLKSIGWGERAGDEPADDMIKSGLSGSFEEFFSGVTSFLAPVLSGNLLPLGLGAGKKCFFWHAFVIWRSRSSPDVLNWRWDWARLGAASPVRTDESPLVKWFSAEMVNIYIYLLLDSWCV